MFKLPRTQESCRRLRQRFLLVLVFLYILSQICAGNLIVLRDVTKKTGIIFKHTDGSSGQHYVMETVSAGLALFDYDNDGDIDIYFLNGAPLKGIKFKTPPTNALYRNDGGWKFTDVTEEAGVGDREYGLGVAVGDYDNDGDLDIYTNNYGPNVLYRNNGDGTFTDVTNKAGVTNDSKVGAGACFLDADKDGDLDLYVSNYLDFSYDKHVPILHRGVPAYATPRYYLPLPDNLYRNNRDGTFTDVSESSGVGQHAGWGMGIVCADYDNDGDTDVFIGNDVAENFLFQNDGTGKFEEVGLLSGCAYDLHGDQHGSMGSDCGDYDNDGLLDFYVTSYEDQLATLYRNLGDGLFEDVTMLTGAGAGTLPHVTWGNSFVDFDNDGDIDIVVLNSRREPTILRNDTQSKGHWLQVRLLGINTNRDGVGAHVKVVAGDLTLWDEVHSGRGYQSHYGTRLHFGLGNRDKIDRIEVRWIGGGIDVFKDITVDQLLTITEGTGRAQ